MTSASGWQEANQHGLCRALDRVYSCLARTAGEVSAAPATDSGEATALGHIARAFGLSRFETDVLLLCAGMELESRFATLLGSAQGDSRLAYPTFAVAMSALPDAHWSAVNSEGPLRYWRLIEVSAGSLLRGALRIDERILQFLAGIGCFDERLEAHIHAAPEVSESIPSLHRDAAKTAAGYWAAANALQPILLTGRRASDLRQVTGEICRLLGRSDFALRAADMPSHATEREQLARLWNRESRLTGAVLSIQAAESDLTDTSRISALLDRLEGPVIIEGLEGSLAEQLPGLHIRIPALGPADRKSMWIESLGSQSARMNGRLDRLAESFDLDAHAIRLASDLALSSPAGSDVGREVWSTCLALSRRSLDGLAQRVDLRARWSDIVLPELQLDTLREIVAQVRQRPVVHGEWGFRERYSRGLGVTALFAGASGTGKTMAAEVIAAELDLDLYQIDLAGVVSKYIGETEKNLRRIFDAAEDGGAVLLFDEADAVFGKRSEIRDSHDRYANLEISYLLQRMEAYRGLAILTTNMKQALDNAFLRRIRFVVQFPFPGAKERQRIWERVFPEKAPLGAIDFNLVSKLNIAGGVIRNIATHAAFLAADQGTRIGMDHLLSAARVEYGKLDRPLTPTETGGWA
jgi:hypothetical protein